MKKTTMYFSDTQAEALAAQAVQIGIPFAEMVRRALDEWLVAHRGNHPMTTQLEQMIAAMIERANVPSPRIQIIISPKYLDQPLFSREELDKHVRDLNAKGVIPWRMRGIQQGLISLEGQSKPGIFEVNLYGLICYTLPLTSWLSHSSSFSKEDVVYDMADLLCRVLPLFGEITMGISIQVSLEGIKGHEFVSGTKRPYQALEDTIIAKTDTSPETLKAHFTDHVVELIYQLMWAFGWTDKQAINSFVRGIVQVQWPELS